MSSRLLSSSVHGLPPYARLVTCVVLRGQLDEESYRSLTWTQAQTLPAVERYSDLNMAAGATVVLVSSASHDSFASPEH